MPFLVNVISSSCLFGQFCLFLLPFLVNVISSSCFFGQFYLFLVPFLVNVISSSCFSFANWISPNLPSGRNSVGLPLLDFHLHCSILPTCIIIFLAPMRSSWSTRVSQQMTEWERVGNWHIFVSNFEISSHRPHWAFRVYENLFIYKYLPVISKTFHSPHYGCVFSLADIFNRIECIHMI